MQDLINAAPAGSTVVLEKDYECEDGFRLDGIKYEKYLTIDGNGHTLDARGNSRIFEIHESGEVKNLNIINGNGGDGWGMIWFKYNGIVTNCNFDGNTASDEGGAIYLKKGSVINCTFTNNRATGNYGDGGAIYAYSMCNVTNCTFINNYGRNGGAVRTYGPVINCTFIGNTAWRNGGAIYEKWESNVINCTFINNAANENGGALYYNEIEEDIDIINCNFTGNNASAGSAIYFTPGSVTKTLTNCILLDNRVNAALQVIKNENNLTITLTGNDNLLTAIYSPNDVTFNNVTYYGLKEITNTDSSTTKPSRSNVAYRQNVTVYVIDGDKIDVNVVKLTDDNGMTDVIPIDIESDSYYISVHHIANSYYNDVEKIFAQFTVNITSQETHNKTVNLTAECIFKESMPGYLQFVLPDGKKVRANYNGNGTWWAQHTFNDYDIYQVNASYIELDNVTVNNATINISKADSSITLDDVTLDYGQSKNVTVATQGATGITANINGTNVTVINNYTITITDLAAGNYTLTVTTIADEDHNPVTATSKITVNKVDSTLTVDNIIFDYGSEGYGNVSFTGASTVIANVIGQPKAVVNVNGKKITVSGLDAGTYALNVTTVPDENHTAVTQTAAITVNKAHTEIILGNESFDMKAIEYVVLRDTLNPAEAGNLTYTSSNRTIVRAENGAIMADAAGTAIVTVSYDGNENYKAAESKTIKVTVRLNDASVSVENTTLDLYVDDTFDLNATQDPWFLDIQYASSNESVVTVNDEGIVTAVGEGTATITLNVGDNITHAINSTEVTVNVKKIDTIIDVDENSLDLKVDDETVVVATLTPADAGNVTFTSSDDDIAYVDAKGNVVANGKGQAIITVSFAGNNKYAAAENRTITVNVSLDDASVTVDNDTLDLMVGETYAINATKKPDTILLDITYTSSDDSVATVDENGIVTAVGEGTAIITVEVGDDEIYALNSTTVTVNVKDNMINVSAPDVIKHYNSTERFVVTVTDSRGNPLANQSVIISVNGVNYTRTTDANGTASIAINLISGQYNVTTTVDNETVNSTVTIKSTISADDISKVEKAPEQFVATFTDSTGKLLTDGKAAFNINGVMYYRAIGSNGQAKLNLNLEANTYIITTYNPVTNEQTGNLVTINKRIVNNSDVTKYYRNDTQYHVTVLGDDGKAVGEGETVTFNINGVFYNRTTDENGIATLNINLYTGEYIITSMYKGCLASNIVKVLPIMTAQDIEMKYRDETQFKATLVDGQGKAYANQTITFNINGVFYNRTTDDKGVAALNINLIPGEYIITSQYGQFAIANTIIIKSP